MKGFGIDVLEFGGGACSRRGVRENPLASERDTDDLAEDDFRIKSVR